MSIVNQVEVFPMGVQTILLSPHDFYLTGSRYFGTAHAQKSDWDFFANVHEIGIFNWLKDNGFKKQSSKSYSKYGNDGFCVEVWYRQDGPRGCDMIQVQLVHDANLKNRAQRIIRDSIDPELLSYTVFSNAIWKTVFNALAKSS